LPSTNAAQTCTSKKRKSRVPVQDQEAIKEDARVEEETYHSPHIYISTPPTLELKEVPSSTKATTNKGRSLHFSLSPLAASTKIRRPFTRSSTLKEAVED